jgi:hypothetical protein
LPKSKAFVCGTLRQPSRAIEIHGKSNRAMLAFQVRPWQVQSFVEPFKTKQDGFNLRLQDMSMDLDLLAVTVIYRYRFFGGSCSHFELANPDKWRVTHSTRPKRRTL